MRLVILDDASAVGVWVANYVAKRIRAFAPTAERPFVLGLPTGSSPLTTYRHLVKMHKAGEVSFAHVVTFKCVSCGAALQRAALRAAALSPRAAARSRAA